MNSFLRKCELDFIVSTLFKYLCYIKTSDYNFNVNLFFLHERAFVINLKLFETNIIHSFSVLKINCLIDQFCDFFLFSVTAISLIHVI